jgi:hypothetical protein
MPSAAGGPKKLDAELKRQLIVELKKRIDSVLAQVRDATGNFQDVDRLEQIKPLPPTASGEVTVLANQARQFRVQVGYEVTFYECLSEIETVDGLVLVDVVTRDIAAKDMPEARKELINFRKRYSEPTGEAYKALWRYLNSTLSLCDRLKAEAEKHIRELREIYKIYPNPVTAEKIRQLESQLQ